MLETTRPILHLILHVLVPFITAKWLTRTNTTDNSHISRQPIKFTNSWQQAFLVMMLTMVIDIDHLLAEPIYQAGRCSINFHPLHTPIPIFIYFILCWPKKTRVIGIGLMIHMVLDSLDCAMMG